MFPLRFLLFIIFANDHIISHSEGFVIAFDRHFMIRYHQSTNGGEKKNRRQKRYFADGKEINLKEHIIEQIIPGSIAEELALAPGDRLISINGQEIADVFDYHYLTNEEYLTVLIGKADGEEWELEIEKEYEEDLGIVFASGLMDEYRCCQNRCIFCFIDQMPEGMRKTLYFKDDDSRLSFLQGNYVTLTNLKEADMQRIIRYKLGPINISVHTTNSALRCRMLNNRFAGEALDKIRRFYEAGIPMNGQIVLCKGINDGAELDRTIEALAGYLPRMESLSVVPVGLSRYRQGLYPLSPFTREDAKEVLAQIHHWQKICYEKSGLHFVHASDEWYLLAGEALPEEARYDGYLQLENGVGMLRLLETEFLQALEEAAARSREASAGKRAEAAAASERPVQGETTAISESNRPVHHLTIATGLLAADAVRALTARFMQCFPQYQVEVIAIKNNFFGEQITVSGLLTGQDLMEQLKGRKLGERLLLPCNLLRSGEEVFLDDVTLTDLKGTLQVPVDIVESNGHHFVECLLKDGWGR